MLAVLDIQELQQDLKSFGLNPEDWKLTPEFGGYFKIESDTDEDFVFLGMSQNKKWQKIEVLSL